MLEELKAQVGQVFEKNRHGRTTRVKLEEVRKREVLLSQDERADKFTLSISEFTKFFKRAT